MEKIISRGYVKWTDEDGVFHKELLADHPELLDAADPREQLAAEEARRLHEAAKEYLNARDEAGEDDVLDTLEALREAPDDVLTAADLVAELEAAEHPEVVAEFTDTPTEEVKDEALAKLRAETTP